MALPSPRPNANAFSLTSSDDETSDAGVPSPRPPVTPSFATHPVSPGGQSSGSSDSEPELYVNGLRNPALFLPMPTTDPLTTLLTKHVPAEYRPVRDTSGSWKNENDNSLIMSNSWRAVARMAQEKILHVVKADDISGTLDLWYLRLSALARMRLYNQAAAECSNLWSFLTSSSIGNPRARAYLFEHVVPFELLVLNARVRYWAGDVLGHLDELSKLITRCRRKAREYGRAHAAQTPGHPNQKRKRKDEDNVETWKERAARVGLIMASQLLEMQDYRAAQKLLHSIVASSGNSSPSAQLLSALGRTALMVGDLALAKSYFTQASSASDATDDLRDTNNALVMSAGGDWHQAVGLLEAILSRTPDNVGVVNDLAVALLNIGRLQDAIDGLEASLRSSPSSVVVAEPLIFNLATLYELRSPTIAQRKKRELLIETAKWSGDGLRVAALKLPAV